MEESKKTEQQEVQQQQQTQELNAEGNASTLWVDPYPPERETRIFPGDSPYPWWCFIKYIVGPGVNDDFTVVGQKNDLAEWPRAPNRESPEAWQLRYQYFDFVIAKYCWRIEACQYPAWCLFFDDNYHSVGLEYPVRAHWYGDRNDWFMYDWDAAPHLLKEKHPELYDKYVEDTEKYNATLPPEKRMAPFTKHESELRYNLPTPIQIDGTSLVKIYPNILYEPYRYVLHIDEDGGNQYAPGQFDVRIQPDTYSVNTNMYFNGTCVIIPFQPVQFASISLVNHPTQFLSVATCGTNSYNADFNVRTQAKETKLGLVIMNEGDSRYRITIDDHYIFPATGGSRAINGDFDIRSHPHKEEDRNVWLVKFDYNEKAFTITSETHPNLYLSIDPANKNADGEIDVRTSTKPCYWNVEGHEKRNIMHNRKLQREKFEKELLEKKAQQLQKETEKLEKDTEKLVAS